MNKIRYLPFFLFSAALSASASDSDNFTSGVEFAKGNKGTVEGQFNKAGNNINDFVPEADANGAQKKYGEYYGGVDSSGSDMNAPGLEQFNTTQWGLAIQEHKRNAPNMPGVRPDDDFLNNGKDAINNAEKTFDPQLCKDVSYDKVTTIKHECERDLSVMTTCVVSKIIKWSGGQGVVKPLTLSSRENRTASGDLLPITGSSGNYTITYRWVMAKDGYLSGGKVTYGGHETYWQGITLSFSGWVNIPSTFVKAGQEITLTVNAKGWGILPHNYLDYTTRTYPHGEFVDITYNFQEQTVKGVIQEVNSCDQGK